MTISAYLSYIVDISLDDFKYIRKDKRELINSHEKAQAHHKMDFLEAILDTSDSGIMVIDKNGTVLFTNSKFSDIWAFPKEILEKNEAGRLLSEYIMDQLPEK